MSDLPGRPITPTASTPTPTPGAPSRPSAPSSPETPPAADHDRHDPLRVAEAADRGGRLPADLAACPACVALHAELVALAAALPEAALPARPRDFRLTPADAARLRGWRRWWDAVGTSRDVLTRPLAIGLTTLGLAGLLVSAVPSVLPFGSAASGTGTGTELAPMPSAPAGDRMLAAPGSIAPAGAPGGPAVADDAAPTAAALPLTMASVVSIALGVSLVGLRAARR